MLHLRTAVLGLAALAVTACGPLGTVTRSAPYESTAPMVLAPAQSIEQAPEVVTRAVEELPAIVVAPSYNVVAVEVDVPTSLRVSEANTLIPLGDIVWQEDLPGDRYAQVQAILVSAVERGVAQLDGSTDIAVKLTVTRFHALSHRARYTVGGKHNIQFDMAIFDAKTGMQIGASRHIDASLEGLGGQMAIQAERAGNTQKVRITAHVAQVIRNELTTNSASFTQLASN